jgi:hypothetical protein
MISVIPIPIGCVYSFIELERILNKVDTNDSLYLWASIKWALKDKDLRRILAIL